MTKYVESTKYKKEYSKMFALYKLKNVFVLIENDTVKYDINVKRIFEPKNNFNSRSKRNTREYYDFNYGLLCEATSKDELLKKSRSLFPEFFI